MPSFKKQSFSFLIQVYNIYINIGTTNVPVTSFAKPCITANEICIILKTITEVPSVCTYIKFYNVDMISITIIWLQYTEAKEYLI